MINTGIVGNMRVRNAPGREKDVVAALERVYARRNYSPERVAKAIVYAIKRNKKITRVSPEARLMYYMEHFRPFLSRIIARRVARRLFGPYCLIQQYRANN